MAVRAARLRAVGLRAARLHLSASGHSKTKL